MRLLRIFIDPSGIEQTVHRWIEKSIEKGVKELDLDFDLALEPFRMPFRLMDVPTLTTLKLTYCKVTRLPRDLRGLSSLKTLVLRKAVLEDLTVDSFLFNCINLETLDLAECYGITRLRVFAVRHRRFKVLKVGYSYELSETRVEAPTLQCLHYCGTIQGLRINVEHVDGESKLRDVMLNFQMARSGVTRSCLVEKLIANILLNVEVLTITSAFLEGLTTRIRDGVYGSIQFWLWNLKELQLYVDSTSYCNLYDISSIVAKCPSIEKLFLDMNDTNFHGGTYWEFHQKPSLEDSPAIFQSLKFLKLRGFKFLSHELELVEYFLKRSPKLESMVLLLSKNGSVDIQPRDAAVCAYLFRIWQANSEAQVHVCEHRSDESPSPKHSRVWY
ncbi:FBD domain containing protein [Parasponia andersonii]|uniref:FBD domain containing protein n=1 Tax=Parasponia andersonii TaxID=3476 RepID=A0A2P5DCB4_PARAD|nr:FBD domain containing protein [Parasponia andersonii]